MFSLEYFTGLTHINKVLINKREVYMEDLSYNILNEFKVNHFPVKKYRGSYIIKDKNYKIIYKNYYSTENIIKAYEISNIVLKSEIKTTDRFYKTKKNGLTCFYDGQSYIMNDYLDFNQDVFEKSDLFLMAIKELGKFHKIEIGKNLCLEIKNNYIEDTEKNIRYLNNLKKRVLSFSRKMDFDILFLNSCQIFINDLEKSLSVFNSNYFNKILENSIMEKKILHGNIKEETIVSFNRDIYINSFFGCYIGIQLEDIGKAYIRYLKNSTEPLPFDKVISTYNEIIPLNKNDKDIIKAFMIYPYKYIWILHDFYKKSRTWAPTSFNKSLKEEIDLHDRLKKQINLHN